MWNLIDFQKLSLTKILLSFLLWTISIWLLQYLWQRRHLYKTSINLPGPLALPFIGSAFYFFGNPFDTFGQITKMLNYYPGVFRVWLGPRLFYAVSDPKYLEILLTSPHMLRKEKLYGLTAPVIGEGLFSSLSVSHWKKHRKIIMPTFNQKILDGFMDIFTKQSKTLNTQMEKFENEQNVDILKLISRCTLDIICETAMGVKIKAQTFESDFPQWVDRVLEIIMIRIFNIIYHSEIIFRNSQLGKDFYYCTGRIRSFTRGVVAEKKTNYKKNLVPFSDAPKRKAFLDLLIEITNEDGCQLLTDEELMDETITLLIAGSDTTATTNCFTLTMLAMQQDIQEKVLNEILEVVGLDGDVALEHLPQLKYLERVIKETLRLFPVGAFLVRTADEDIHLDDVTIHKDCSVVFGISRVHTDEKYWPDPYKFDPDRFLPENVAKRPVAAYIPFSYGPRNCIGLKYAMMAMKTLLATVIRKYHVYTLYKNVKDIELKTNLVLRPKDGFKLYFKRRNL